MSPSLIHSQQVHTPACFWSERDVWRFWMLFSSIVAVVGVGMLMGVGLLVMLPEHRALSFVEHDCIVRDKQVGASVGGSETGYRPEVLIEYQVAGATHTVWTYDATGMYSSGRNAALRILDQFEIGRSYPCYYDPAAPQTAILVRGHGWFSLLLFGVSLTLAGLGVIGLGYSVLRFWLGGFRMNWGRGRELSPVIR